MDAREFKVKLERCMPNRSDLTALSLSDDEVDAFLRSFLLPERGSRLTETKLPGGLGHLFDTYDPSDLEIGMIRFQSTPKADHSGWVIGKVESDWLKVDMESGEVCVEEFASPSGRKIWSCADNGESFLDALIPAACFLGRCLYEQELAGNQIARRECIRACVDAAGGKRYSSFYEMLIGS